MHIGPDLLLTSMPTCLICKLKWLEEARHMELCTGNRLPY